MEVYESAYAKPKTNFTLNLALAICFSGLFFMLVGGASAAAVLIEGSKALGSSLSYLFGVSLYLGLIVLALAMLVYTFELPQPKPDPNVQPVFAKPVGRRDFLRL